MLNKVRNKPRFPINEPPFSHTEFLIRIQMFSIHLIVWDAFNNLIVIALKLLLYKLKT
ncbi:hypothetical protein SAMN06265171_102153 [Chryseobacterium rhizoplanae]|uniref:Uncharacterized protein n=1 Tax=Chryseobacterium rhizoplanae TaxID=1609531 RepID=A0A521BVA2_9FLAO|nr:hypothetical protein SAMN06265171_102153 [Chryseobacterium rhizoplanae]